MSLWRPGFTYPCFVPLRGLFGAKCYLGKISMCSCHTKTPLPCPMAWNSKKGAKARAQAFRWHISLYNVEPMKGDRGIDGLFKTITRRHSRSPLWQRRTLNKGAGCFSFVGWIISSGKGDFSCLLKLGCHFVCHVTELLSFIILYRFCYLNICAHFFSTFAVIVALQILDINTFGPQIAFL